jgi:DNA segregation ATPase FtsK/SpoIIIE-like protein
MASDGVNRNPIVFSQSKTTSSGVRSAEDIERAARLTWAAERRAARHAQKLLQQSQQQQTIAKATPTHVDLEADIINQHPLPSPTSPSPTHSMVNDENEEDEPDPIDRLEVFEHIRHINGICI